MFENIETNRANFCIGPQAGTYCTVDNEISPIIMLVKNDSGSVIRNYTFYPQDTLYVGPKQKSSYPILPNGDYDYSDFISIQYIGPYDQASYFDGAVFYTLERRAKGVRRYYTYDDPNDLDKVDTRIEYDSNIVRKWCLDNVNFRLLLDRTYVFNSDDNNWFDAKAFAVENIVTTFDKSAAANTGVIEITTTSGLKKYDSIFLGPSTDVSNPGKVEEVYVHSVNGTTVEIKTYGGEDPPKWEYMEGDPITIFRDIYLFSNSAPLIDSSYTAYGNVSSSGTLYVADQTNYGAIIAKNSNGIYQDVKCAIWNNYFTSLSFVKGSSLIHLDVSDYEVMRMQDIHLNNPTTNELIPLYDIDIKDFYVYTLQKSILQHDDSGNYYEESWDTYNYHIDTFQPYTNTVALSVSERVLLREGQTFITVIVRDQFGVGLLSKDVWFTSDGDIASTLNPIDGYMTTDSNGRATIQYDAGSSYTGNVNIGVKVSGGNSANGSTFIYAFTALQQYHQFNANDSLRTVTIPSFFTRITTQYQDINELLISTRVAYVFPGNKLINNNMNGWESAGSNTKIIQCCTVPTFKSSNNDISVTIRLSKLLLNEPSYNNDANQVVGLMVKELITTDKYISSNFISRHLSYGNSVSTSLDQFVFIQEAIPAMWSEKNNINTDIWFRLRPFAASLNPSTLVVKLKEESYIGNSYWQDVSYLGVITMFDAGGGLLGIDFSYDPMANFHHNSIIYIHIEVYDNASVPNLILLDYWFKIIQDYKAPYIVNRVPAQEEANVPINTPILFDLIDDGEGVDINTLEVFINQRKIGYSYDEYEYGNYHINCINVYSFYFGQEVTVNVSVTDLSDNNNRLISGWTFYCVESTGPWIDMDNTVPGLCVEGAKRKQNVSMQLYGIQDTGIKYDSIKMEIGGRYRNMKITPIVYRIS